MKFFQIYLNFSSASISISFNPKPVSILSITLNFLFTLPYCPKRISKKCLKEKTLVILVKHTFPSVEILKSEVIELKFEWLTENFKNV